jgi:hypothetical protein
MSELTIDLGHQAEAHGPMVGSCQPSENPAPENKVGSRQPCENQIRRGAQEFALIEKERSHTWDRWKHVIVAVLLVDGLAMRKAGTNAPKGAKFNRAVRDFLRCYGLDRIHKSDRSRMRKYAGKLEVIDAWRSEQPPERQLELNHPRIVYVHWERSTAAKPNTRSEIKSESDSELESKKLDLTAWPAADVTAALAARDIDWFLNVMPKAWCPELTRRVAKLPQANDEPFIKASEMLRQILSSIKIASAPETTPAVAASHEKVVLTALRQLNVVLAGAGIDEVTIIRKYAKEKRCHTKQRRRAA